MSRPGRDFEVLISRIEKWLAPKGADITSPDYLTDVDTGVQREVDASIRMQIGSEPVLIAIECRDHARKADVKWIEEIATRRHSIGATRIIAVSSTGFSEPAMKKAKCLGIEVRILSEVTDEMITQWARDVRVCAADLRWNLVEVEVKVASAAGQDEIGLPPAVWAAYARDPNGTPLGYERSTNRPFTVQALIEDALGSEALVVDDVEPGCDRIRKTIAVGFPEREFYVFTNRGEMSIREMRITLDLWMTVDQPVSWTVYSYASPDDEVMQMAKSSLSFGEDKTYTLLLSQKSPGDLDQASDSA